MKSESHRISIFYLGCLILQLKALLAISGTFRIGTVFENVLIVLGTSCMVWTILRRKYSIKVLSLYMLITIVTLYSSLLSKNYALLMSVMCILALRGQDFEKFISNLRKRQGVFIIIQVSFAIIRSVVDSGYVLYTIISSSKRYHLGFSHPNVFAAVMLGYILLWVWSYYDYIKGKHIVIMTASFALLYILTESRTMLITAFFLVLFLSLKHYGFFQKAINETSKFIVPFCALLTMGVVFLYLNVNVVAQAIDVLLSGRVRLGAYGFNREGITLFGKYISYVGGQVAWSEQWRLNSFTFDNLYSACFVNLGTIWIVAFVVLFYKLAKFRDPKISIMVVLWAIYGLTEVHGQNGFVFFPIFIISYLLGKKSYRPQIKK